MSDNNLLRYNSRNKRRNIKKKKRRKVVADFDEFNLVTDWQ